MDRIVLSELEKKSRKRDEFADDRPLDDMNAEKAIAMLRIHTNSRGSSLATLNRELLRARFNKVVQQRTKLETGLDVKKYKSMTDQRHVYEMLTHEAFQYLTMIRRTKVVNGVLIETYEDPSDDESEEDESEEDESGREDAVPFTEEGERERLLCVGGKKVVKRAGKKAEVKRHINFYKTEGTSAIAKMLREYMSKEESEADVDNDYRDMDDLILGKKGPYKFVDFD